MVEIYQTDVFERWLKKLQDAQAKAKILVRIKRLELSKPGDTKPVGGGVSELRISTGPGYRVYFVQRGESVIVLLAGGKKDSQDRDVKRARKLASKLQHQTTRANLEKQEPPIVATEGALWERE